MSLRCDQVEAGYGRLTVLHNLSFIVPEGKITALIGPNGCGKSTLLKTIVGILQPTKGHIYFNGEDITRVDTSKMLARGLAYLQQARAVFPYMSVAENLRLGAYLRDDKKLVSEALGDVFSLFPVLAEKRGQPARNLSGGQQRQLELARALMMRPKMILLDEPSVGLAPVVLDDLYNKIARLKDMGVSLMIAEQNVRKVLSMAHKVYALNLGEIAFEGTPNELESEDRLTSLFFSTKS